MTRRHLIYAVLLIVPVVQGCRKAPQESPQAVHPPAVAPVVPTRTALAPQPAAQPTAPQAPSPEPAPVPEPYAAPNTQRVTPSAPPPPPAQGAQFQGDLDRVADYLERIEAVKERESDALRNLKDFYARLSQPYGSGPAPDAREFGDIFRSCQGYFQRCCDPAAVTCPQVQELHRLWTAYFDSLVNYIVLPFENPQTHSLSADAKAVTLRVEAIRAQADREEARIRSWLSSSRR